MASSLQDVFDGGKEAGHHTIHIILLLKIYPDNAPMQEKKQLVSLDAYNDTNSK